MEDGKKKWKSNKTKREYKITRHYTCQTTFCIYLATCELCQAQYVGQTIRTMQKRHYGHRSEVKTAADGLGEHFNIHAAHMGLNLDTQIDQIMQYCNITIIASVEPDQPWSKSRLDALEADLQDRMMTLEKHGGMNRREERRRIGSWLGQSAPYKFFLQASCNYDIVIFINFRFFWVLKHFLCSLPVMLRLVLKKLF